MILISHRANLHGPSKKTENSPDSIDHAISMGFDVEIDVRAVGSKIFLGHDEPQEEVAKEWLLGRSKSLWIHCKNIEAMDFFDGMEFNHFWHQEDDCTLTSRGFIWTYPGKPLFARSIAVLPETHNAASKDLKCAGVCSDFIGNWIS